MKISLLFSALLAGAILLIGWRNQVRLGTLGETRSQLSAEAARLGISADAADAADASSSRRERRPDKDASTKATAADLIAFAQEMEALQKSGEKPEDMAKFQERILGFMDRMSAMDAAQLKLLIAEFRAAPGLSEETRQGLVGFSVMTLANDHPQVALGLFTEASDLFKDNRINQHMVSSALGNWSRKDPLAALEWVRTNGEKFPDLINDQAKRGLISGAAVQDPKVAFKLIGELGISPKDDDYNNSIQAIVQSAKLPKQRTAVLEALRENLEGIKTEEEKQKVTHTAFHAFALNLAPEGFETASGWIASTNPSPEELASFAQGVSFLSKKEEKGKWLQWMGDTLPEESARPQVKQMIRQWTNDDYQAAGQWLVSAPDGPTKHAAVESYAETVAPYEPDTAAQWALTLPPGKGRDATLKKVQQQIQNKDPAAGAAFAEKHGIK